MRRRLFVWAARCIALVGVLVIGQFVVGRVMTDRAHWSQYLWWIPALWSLLAAWVLWGVSAACGRLALRPGGVMLRPVLLAGCMLASLWLVFGEWGMHRAVLGPRGEARERTLRILHWNQSARSEITGAGELLGASDADIAVVVNCRNNEIRHEIIGTMFEMMAPEAEGTVRVLPAIEDKRESGHIYADWRVIVGTRGKILRAGVVAVGQVTDEPTSWPTGSAAGTVVWCEIDLGERFADPEGGGGSGRPLVLWVVDMPSDPSLWRMDVMRTAAEAVEAWHQPALETTPGGWWRTVGKPVRVPRPDVVIGDFNILRGSASLERLTPGMRDAFEEAGWGRGRSWRQARAIGGDGPGGAGLDRVMRALLPLADWHIDLTRVGERWRTTRYRLVEPGAGPHRVQVVDLVPDGSGA